MTQRRWPESFYRRQALVAECIRVVPPREMPINVWGALSRAGVIVRLTPREFLEFACAVAWVRYREATQRRAERP